jgi:hypothetical protein
MRKLISLVVLVLVGTTHNQLAAQELYVFSDPASNVPAKSLSLKYNGKFMMENRPSSKVLLSRHMAEASIGLNKKLMFRPVFTFSNMYGRGDMRWESAGIYAKYRFLSSDAIHRHFRAAAYIKGLYSANSLRYEELTGDGDQSVVQAGLIFTQLVNKLAVSTTIGWTEVINQERWLKYDGPRLFGYRSLNYSLSSGYLLFPRTYKSYEQTNFNFYLELIGSNAIDRKAYFVDLAPAMQLIVNSNTKINLGYRFQLSGNSFRMASAAPSFSFSVERTFFNTFRK